MEISIPAKQKLGVLFSHLPCDHKRLRELTVCGMTEKGEDVGRERSRGEKRREEDNNKN